MEFMATVVQQKCFVIAPPGLNLEPLEQLLSERGLEAVRLDNLSVGVEVLDSITAALKSAELVIAVIPEGVPSQNLLFELGVASGLGKPIVIFAEPGVDLPQELKGLPYVRASMRDLDEFGRRLDTALRTLSAPPGRTGRRKSRTTRIAASQARERLAEIRTLEPSAIRAGFEGFVRDLFREADVLLSSDAGRNGRGADFAIWINEIEGALGNPILVQVKAGSLNAAALESEEDPLRQYLAADAGSCGIVVYLDLEGKDLSETKPQWPLVIRFAAEELIDLLGEGRFAEELIARRNQAVHGRR
jgi:hypothetical protein